MWDIHGLCKVRNAAVLGMSHWRGCSGSAHAHSSEPRYLSPSCPFDTPGVCHPRVSRLHLLIRLPPQLPHTLKTSRAPKTYPSPEAPSGSADVKTSPYTNLVVIYFRSVASIGQCRSYSIPVDFLFRMSPYFSLDSFPYTPYATRSALPETNGNIAARPRQPLHSHQ